SIDDGRHMNFSGHRSGLLGTFNGFTQRSLRQDTNEVAAVLGGAPHIRDRTRCCLGSCSSPFDRWLTDLLIQKCGCSVLYKKGCGSHCSKSNARSLKLPAVGG